MNPGMIAGVIIDASGSRVSGALVGIDYVRGGTRQITLYNPDEVWVRTIFTESDSNGRFVLFFKWDPLELANAMEIRPTFRIHIQRSQREGDPRYPITRYEGLMARAVSLSAVSTGAIPDLRQPTDLTGIAVDLICEFRGIRLPRAFVSVLSPSADWFSLVAFVRVNARSTLLD